MRIIIFLAAFVFFSCKNGFHSPTDADIEQAVTEKYEARNNADGGGGWEVKEVNVLSSERGNDNRHYNAKVTVKGIHTSPPLANERPDEAFDETEDIELIWRGGKWQCAEE